MCVRESCACESCVFESHVCVRASCMCVREGGVCVRERECCLSCTVCVGGCAVEKGTSRLSGSAVRRCTRCSVQRMDRDGM